ncbi:MAG: efflux RND transporter periplasmic adaptor subunit [Opitutales bacterium]|nr:efflux RND transporter periplasmic adaptor subunit [Opitutales bacterium]
MKYLYGTTGLAVLLLALAGCTREAATVPERATPVWARAVAAEKGYTAERVFVGVVRARRSGEVGFEVAGTINGLAVEVGDAVAPGDVLARLDTRRLEARLAEARAAEAEAHSQLALARSTLQRTQEARRLNAVSQQAEDEAMNTMTGAEARLARTAALVEVIEVDLEKSVLRAPYAATIDVRLVDLGASIAPGQPILRLVSNGQPEIRFTASADAAAHWQLGDRMRVTAPGWEGEGTLTRVRGQRDAQTRAVEAFLELDVAAGAPRPETVVTVRIERPVVQAGFWLERQALTEGTRGLWACFVAVPVSGETPPGGPTHRLERVDLEWLHAAGDRVFVRGPLQSGNVVVREGLHRLTPGLGVRLVDNTVASR